MFCLVRIGNSTNRARASQLLVLMDCRFHNHSTPGVLRSGIIDVLKHAERLADCDCDQCQIFLALRVKYVRPLHEEGMEGGDEERDRKYIG